FVNAVDELVLRIALERFELVTAFLRHGHRTLLDGRQRGRAVMARLAGAEQVQVRAIEQQQARHGRCRSSFKIEMVLAAGSEPTRSGRECTLIHANWNTFVAQLATFVAL